ncbi:MAG TPA: hypothetical protein VMH48_01490 [Methylomirabilota bacterium]|nr:hypothetical protein [Methylomirabilota bacterium]
MLKSGGAGGIIVGIAFTLLFVNAVRGAYAYHRVNGGQGQARPLQMNP